MSSSSRSSADTFKILIATDNHLGYAENDPLRGNDSFNTFEEILCHARDLQVDFILLGGDLFHDNKPSRNTLHNCLRLLRNYCLGNSPVQFQFLSDPSENFKYSPYPVVNYEDPNINISIPVFSIHGNHDNPTGISQLCPLDVINDAGLVNYFGKCLNLQDVTLSPLLMAKGSTKLALYGLGSIRDERLHRMFLSKTIRMLRPTEDIDDWFNMFVLHQNRTRHGEKNYIPDNFLPDFLDLVIWGHEHECRIDPEQTSNRYYISQPGSSVATSLSPGEAVLKHIGLLEIHHREMRMVKIPLETVRQFYIEDIILSDTPLDLNSVNVKSKVMDYCTAKVEELLEKAQLNHSGNEKQPKQPLIRLRVEFDDISQTFSQHHFSQKFIESVANPKDLIIFRRRRKEGHRKHVDDEENAYNADLQIDLLDIGHFSAIDLVKEYFEGLDIKKQMMVLTEKGMGNAVMEFVDKEEKDALSELVRYQIDKTQKYLKDKDVNVDNIEDHIMKFKESKKSGEEAEIQEIIKETRKKSFQKRITQSDEDHSVISDMDVSDKDDDNDDGKSTSPRRQGRARGRARGRGRGVSRGRGSRGRSETTEIIQNDQGSSSRRSRGCSTVQKTLPAFIQTSSKSRRSTNPVITLDSDDDDASAELFSTVSSKKSKPSTSRSSIGTRKRPFTYDSDEEEGPF